MLAWRWDLVGELAPDFIAATGKTLLAAAGGYGIAVVLGLVFAMAQRVPFQPLTFAVRELVELIRSTPLILQIFFVYYVGPQFGVVLSPWTAGLIAIGVHYGAYLSEVYRGGIESVPKGQWEAAKAINLPAVRAYRRIILPQALPPAIAGMGNYLVGIFKDTPMLSVIGVTELMHTATTVGAERYRYLEPYTMVGAIFLAISLPAAFCVSAFERWVRRRLGMAK